MNVIMNVRERFLRVFHYQQFDRPPDFEFGFWTETLEKWARQERTIQNILMDSKKGADLDPRGYGRPDPEGGLCATAERYFGFERRKSLPVNVGLKPRFDRKIIEEDERSQIVRNERGIICRELKEHETMPKWIEFPVKDYEDFTEMKKRYDSSDPERYPDSWEELAELYSGRDYPLGIFCGSLYGWLRHWMGFERLSKKFMKEPDFVDEMMTFLAEHIYKVVKRALEKADEHGIQLDFSAWWEDMCFNKGPLISPELFEEFMVPKYKKITGLLEKYGIDIHYLDSDGRIDELVPLWLEGGINCMFPIESAHTPPERIREKFGKDVLMMGGIDKRALMESKDAIDKELERLVPLMEEGGYIPHIDHRVPADVSFENFMYYTEKKREMIGREVDS